MLSAFGIDFKNAIILTSKCDGICGATAQLRAGVADDHVDAHAGAGGRPSAKSAAGWQFAIV